MEYKDEKDINIENVENKVIYITNCEDVKIKNCYLCKIVIKESLVRRIEELKCCVLTLGDLPDCGFFHIDKCVNSLISMNNCVASFGLGMITHRCCSILCSNCQFDEFTIKKIRTSYVSVKNSNMKKGLVLEGGVHDVEFNWENVLGTIIKEPEGVLKSMTED